MKIRPVGAELFDADGHDTTKLIVVIRTFSRAPKNSPGITTMSNVAP